MRVDAFGENPSTASRRLLALTLLNPMTIVYSGALVLGRQAADAGTVRHALAASAMIAVLAVMLLSS